jgi:uncharacterized protein (TIGR02246 family)
VARSFAWLGCFVALACLLVSIHRSTASGALAAPAPDSAQVQKQIDAGNDQFVKAWTTGDADLFAGCFASDGGLFRGGGAVVIGRDAIRERMKGTFGRYRMARGTIRTTGLWFADDRAYETGKWVFTIGKVDSLGTAAPDSGHYLEIWRLEAGKWRMWRDIGIPEG